MSSISATINGTAGLVPRDSPEERFYRDQHLENNTFAADIPDGGGSLFRQQQAREQGTGESAADDGGRERFVADEEVRVIVVHIRDIRTSDWKGGVKDWVLVSEEGGPNGNAAMVNGGR